MEEIEGGNLLACFAYGALLGAAITNPIWWSAAFVFGPSAAYECSKSFS